MPNGGHTTQGGVTNAIPDWLNGKWIVRTLIGALAAIVLWVATDYKSDVSRDIAALSEKLDDVRHSIEKDASEQDARNDRRMSDLENSDQRQWQSLAETRETLVEVATDVKYIRGLLEKRQP